jgi:site-specific recombinase XerD
MSQSLSGWLDTEAEPAQPLPSDAGAAAQYLAQALGHSVYERWTWQQLLKAYGALPDARRAKPKVCQLLIERPAVIEYWQRGRLMAVAEHEAPGIDQVLSAVLKSHRRRFKQIGQAGYEGVSAGVDAPDALAAAQKLPAYLMPWLQRSGRLFNPHAHTNTLGAADDLAALQAFMRERAGRSVHTWRAYVAELERLTRWCTEAGLGPLSDLTRQDLLRYKAALARLAAVPVRTEDTNADRVALPASGSTSAPALTITPPSPPKPLSEKSQARALAVIASLFRYWHATGYLLGNPAAGFTGGSRAQAGFVPTRFIPGPLLEKCDAWVAQCTAAPGAGLEQQRLAAIWTLFRFSGARLAELAWHAPSKMPKLELDAGGKGLLTVRGKGNKIRAIPLPSICNEVLRSYRVARGLAVETDPMESVPLLHGAKGGALGEAGLYKLVKNLLLAVASDLQDSNPAGAALLREASPHWLRHAYARTLVVDKRVPLPAAQALLGHASVQTTAAYAKTDLTQLREFVEAGFG